MKKSLVAVFLVALLAGCSLLKPVPPASSWSGPALGANAVEEALRYYAYAKKLPAADLNREHEAIRQSFTRSHDDFARIQYALLLSLPGTRFHDEGRALKILEGWQKDDDTGLRRFGAFLAAQLAEQRRLDDSADALRARLKEEQRRADEAEAKLNALKSIERSLLRQRRAP
ncbi:MAG: hypothetical protein AB7U30_06690 [Sulfuricellaceae bacterium]